MRNIPVFLTPLSLAVILLLSPGSGTAQSIDSIINKAAVMKIEKTLASDAMRGRGTFTPDIERAADYIEAQFRAAGLKTWNGGKGYRQPFALVRSTPLSATAVVDGQSLTADQIITVSTVAELKADNNSGYEKAYIKAGMDARVLSQEARKYVNGKKNTIVFVDSSYAGAAFGGLKRFTRQQFSSPRNVIFILTGGEPAQYSIQVRQEVKLSPLANVVGILPGRSRKKEYVIFSGHYDHLGVKTPDSKGDSIYNGANDDASGTTAVILLARYYAKHLNNERTLVFAAFTAEEIGGYGSQYFSQQFDPANVMAMFNIEMIGTESKWGNNSAYITGYERTDMGKILEKNLAGSRFSFYPDPYLTQGLFYRSDNATLARQGVPAHTISTSKMDSEPYYHTAEDEVGTLDMKNMAEIIKSIALSARSIISGKDSPSRVDTTLLR